MNIIEQSREFALAYYDAKDELHGFPHVERVIDLANSIAKHENVNFSKQILTIAGYFHGFIYSHEALCKKFLSSLEISQEVQNSILGAAWESQTSSANPVSVEGQLLHDAHLLEGGHTFIITKSLVVGTARGQSLDQTLKFIEENIIGKFKCFFPSCVKEYQEKEDFEVNFLKSLRQGLGE